MPYQLVQDYFHQQSETISWQNMAKLRSPAKGLTFNFKTRNKFAGAKGIRNHQRFAKLLFSIWLASLKIHLKDAFRQMFPWIRSFSTFGLHLVRVFNRLGPVIRYHYTFLLFFSHGNWKVNKKIWKTLENICFVYVQHGSHKINSSFYRFHAAVRMKLSEHLEVPQGVTRPTALVIDFLEEIPGVRIHPEWKSNKLHVLC